MTIFPLKSVESRVVEDGLRSRRWDFSGKSSRYGQEKKSRSQQGRGRQFASFLLEGFEAEFLAQVLCLRSVSSMLSFIAEFLFLHRVVTSI